MSPAAVAIAMGLDHRFGEPPLAVHPVRWAGRFLDLMGDRLPSTPPPCARRWGAVAWAAGVLVSWSAGRALERRTHGLSPGTAAVVRGAALWTVVSWRLLADEVAGVERGLARDLDTGRRAVGGLVSRDVDDLDAGQVRAAAIESLAENASDAVVAPLVWFALGGLPMALAYRWINTADAMWGYRTERWIDAGRAAARADDVANLLPARLTGLALAPTSAWRQLPVEAARTPSPNAGWPIAAIALRLGIRCDKPGVYACNPHGRTADARDVRDALRIVGRRVGVLVTVCALVARRPRCRH